MAERTTAVWTEACQLALYTLQGQLMRTSRWLCRLGDLILSNRSARDMIAQEFRCLTQLLHKPYFAG